MPSKNRIKTFLRNGYYHIYNRGVNKRSIFTDQQDYRVFLSYLKTYLTPKDEVSLRTSLADSTIPWSEKDKILKLLRLNNFADTIKLLAFVLMPNHFHLLIQQFETESISALLGSLGTRYVMYFNRKQQRKGPLFQDIYKAVVVETDEQLLHLSRYIHLNPRSILKNQPALAEYQYSSYSQYLGKYPVSWVDPKPILQFFKSVRDPANNTYKEFVETHQEFPGNLQKLTLDED